MYKKTSLGGSCRYNDFMRNIDKIFTEPLIGGTIGENDGLIPGINTSRENMPKGDLIIDLRGGYQLTKIIRLGFVINNLMNVEYMSRPADMKSPRTFAVQCNLKI